MVALDYHMLLEQLMVDTKGSIVRRMIKNLTIIEKGKYMYFKYVVVFS